MKKKKKKCSRGAAHKAVEEGASITLKHNHSKKTAVDVWEKQRAWIVFQVNMNTIDFECTHTYSTQPIN